MGKADRKKLRGQIPVAYITLNEEGKQNEKVVLTQIRTVCEEEFNERYRPVDYVVIDELPLTPNGKVDYKALEE